jgi:putative transposase
VVIEPIDKEIISFDISKERNMFVVERFLSGIVNKHGQYPVSTADGGIWYPHACHF